MNFETDGAERYAKALSASELAMLNELADQTIAIGPGTRLTDEPLLSQLLASGGSMSRIACSKLGERARPVRAVLFDKRDGMNWALGWHQDRTLAVEEKVETPGFGPWSKKHGIIHVEPPFDIINDMITLRAHLDPCGEDNAPLLIAPGSHRLGRIPASEVAGIARKLGTVPCLAGSGAIWIYSTAIAHASEKAVTVNRRRVLQVDYANEALPGTLRWCGI